MVKSIPEIKKTINRLIDILKDKGINTEQVILYGSYAANNASEESDIDIVVISSDLKRYAPLERLEFLSLVSWDLPDPLEIIGYTPDEIKGKKGKSIFWDEIQNTGQILYKAA